MHKLGLEKTGKPEIELPTFIELWRKQGNSRKNIYFCFTDYTKAFDCVDHSKLWKTLKEMGVPDHLTCLLENLYVDQEATVKTNMDQWTGSKLGKEYVKAVYCHPVYLTSIQSIPYEKMGWINHKLESRYPGEISTASDMQIIPL